MTQLLQSAHAEMRRAMATPVAGPNRIHIYARESTQHQKDALNTQLETLRTFVKHVVAISPVVKGKEYIDECSAFRTAAALRPRWSKMISRVRHGDIIAVERVDRAGRDNSVMIEFDNLTARGVVIYILELNTTYTECIPRVRALLDIAIAESTAISVRTSMHKPLYGYITSYTGSRLERVPDMAVINAVNAEATVARATLSMANMNTGEDLNRAYMQELVQDVSRVFNRSPALIKRVLLMPYGPCSVCRVSTEDCVVTCSGCYIKVHWQCVTGHTNTIVGNWYCTDCIAQNACTRMRCQNCHVSAYTDTNPIIICDTCNLGYHRQCMPACNTRGDWSCTPCVRARR